MVRKKAVTSGSKPELTSSPIARSANMAEQQGSEMSPSPSPSKAKRTPRKTAARGRWGEEQLLTSEKSQLITLDLVKLLAKPEAWNFLEVDEKREILSLLPEKLHPNLEKSGNLDAMIPPPPQSFLRYSNHWRDGIRQFQTDLQNGRYNPEWLRQADEARQQRADGDFDSFKEREYEQFWGQKQRTNPAELVGESGKVKLGTLVTAGVIRPGDVWKYSRVFGKDENRVEVVKEARVLEINDSKLKFVIPSGQRVFLSSQHGSQICPASDEGKETSEDADVNMTTATSTPCEEKEAKENADVNAKAAISTPCEEKPVNKWTIPTVVIINRRVDATKPSGSEELKRKAPELELQPPVKRKRGRPPKKAKRTAGKFDNERDCGIHPAQEQESCPSAPLDVSGDANPSILETAESANPPDNTTSSEIPKSSLLETANPYDTKSPESPGNIDQKDSEILSAPAPSQNDPDPSSSQMPVNEFGEIILDNISTPSMLATKIVQADGRISTKTVDDDGNLVRFHQANPWKEIRCYRNNQDMGSLWDVRQAWFLKQNCHL